MLGAKRIDITRSAKVVFVMMFILVEDTDNTNVNR